MPVANYRGKTILSALLLLSLVAISCRKLYSPPSIAATNSYLVVEGAINSGDDSTIIKLSRTVKLSNKTAINPELNAILTIESDQNTSYPLKELGNGVYAYVGLNLNNSYKYRLEIKTSNGKQYLSDYVDVINSPPIDSVNYDTQGTNSGPGLNIYVNTHDANNKARYFRWDYQETWMFDSAFLSAYKSNGDTVLARDLINDNINVCWRSDTSSTIVLGSSAKLLQNVIARNPITAITSTSEKIGLEYSILVRQYALTADAYNFYSNLKKNTEQLGSIFDAQPSEISGNIHCVSNPSEPVIGYVSVGSSTSQRIFISKRTLPNTWKTASYYSNCALAADPENPPSPCCSYAFVNRYGQTIDQVDQYINFNSIYFHPGGDNPLIPVDPIVQPGGLITGYTATTKECADCTLRGSNKKPSFWQ